MAAGADSRETEPGPGTSGPAATGSLSTSTADTGATLSGVDDASEDTGSGGGGQSTSTGADADPFPPEPSPSVFPSPGHRIANWTPIGSWEMEWNGEASAADLPRPYHTWFDNPHDDDLDEYPLVRGACRYRFDDPAVGFLTVDRVNTPQGAVCPLSAGDKPAGGRTFTGNLWKRDPYLSSQTGFTLEVDVEILDKSIQIQDEAFVMQTSFTHGSFAVYLSPHCVKIGGVRRPPETTRHSCATVAGITARAMDTAGQHRYRMTLAPDSHDVTLYVDDDPIPFLEGQGNAFNFTQLYAPGETPAVSDTQYEHPYVLIGDNTGNIGADVAENLDVSAAYVLDGLRWTRGVFGPEDKVAVPDAEDGPLRRRWPPQLPANVAVGAPGFEFDGPLPTRTGGPHVRAIYGDAVNTWQVDDGMLTIAGSSNGRLHYERLEGLIGNDGWTVEARLRVGDASTQRALAIELYDHLGMVTLLLSPDKIELALGGKFRGYSAPVELDTTDEFHTYRIVRKANDSLIYLFVDDVERPLIADFPMSGTQNNAELDDHVRLRLGWIGQVFPTTWVEIPSGEFTPVAEGVNAEAVIDHIRWSSDVALGELL